MILAGVMKKYLKVETKVSLTEYLWGGKLYENKRVLGYFSIGRLDYWATE